MTTFAQTLLATVRNSVQEESDKSDEFAFLVERMPVIQVPLAATILIPGRGPQYGELKVFSYFSPWSRSFHQHSEIAAYSECSPIPGQLLDHTRHYWAGTQVRKNL